MRSTTHYMLKVFKFKIGFRVGPESSIRIAGKAITG